MLLMKPAAAALAIAMAATTFVPTTADARHRHHNGAFIAGAAGFAAGALLGSLAQPRYRCGYYDDCYAPSYSRYYYDEPRYYAPAPVYVAPRAYYREDRGYYRDGCDSSGSVSRPANSLC